MPKPSDALSQLEHEERAYLQQRDELLKRHAGKWVAIVNGKVAAIGDSSGSVIRAAFQKTGSKSGYVARVGRERVVHRIRTVTAGRYDNDYHCPIPKIVAEFRHFTENRSCDVDFIVDTGADLSVVRARVADDIGLWDSAWRRADVGGIGSVPESRPLFAASIHIGNHEIPVEVDCRDDTDEDILRRDVINEFELMVCAKRGQVEFTWVDTP